MAKRADQVPKGTSPSKNIERGNDIAYDNGMLKGGHTPQEAIAADKNSTRKPVPTDGSKE